jgi:hypothetical protein
VRHANLIVPVRGRELTLLIVHAAGSELSIK